MFWEIITLVIIFLIIFAFIANIYIMNEIFPYGINKSFNEIYSQVKNFLNI